MLGYEIRAQCAPVRPPGGSGRGGDAGPPGTFAPEGVDTKGVEGQVGDVLTFPSEIPQAFLDRMQSRRAS